MEEDDSKSMSLQEDSQISLEQFVAENAAGFQEHVEDILEEIEQDGNFSDMTVELYDQKKSYLTRHLTELSRMHKVLTNQISTTLRCSTPFGHDSVLTRDCSGFSVSKTEDSKSSFSLSSGSGSESLILTSKLLISPVNHDARKDKETETPAVLLQKNYNLDEELVSLVNGNTKLKGEIEDTELISETRTADLGIEKEVADLKHALSDCNLKNTKMGDELEASKLKATVSEKVIKDLKQQRSIQDSKEIQLEQELQSVKCLLDYVSTVVRSYEERILEYSDQLSEYEAEISEHDDQITELNIKIKQYTSEISQLKSTHKTKENNLRTSIGKLRKELEEKGESVDDLTKKLDTVQAEKCSQDNLIQELETRLNSLQADHEGVLASSENAQKVTNELTARVLELEREVDTQKEVISVREKEKREAIKQLSSSLDTVQAEKCSQDNLIQELETRLSLLQADHEGVLASSENAQKLTNELTQRVLELEKEVDMQREVISVRDEEKREAIRQLSSALDTVQAEKYSQDNLIQELETRLNSLHADHEEVLASSENAQEVTNELTHRVLELEREVDMQKEAISVRDEEKREAIRQLSSSLDHYKSKYQELYQAFFTKNTSSCFDFLH